MNILFVHQNFPGQYKHIAPVLAADSNNNVAVLSVTQNPENLKQVKGINCFTVAPCRGNTPGIHPWLQETDTKMIRGETAWRGARQLKEQGFSPDIICAHPGWGEALFLKDVWPSSKLLCFFEFYYHATGHDVDFDPEFPSTPEDACRLRMKNINNLLSLEACDWGITPTYWQRQVHPSEFHSKISVIHDGIDTDIVIPSPSASVMINEYNLTLSAGDNVITFVNRNLEPYRGCHTFFRALPEILEKCPDAHVLVIGGNDVSYGARPSDGISYKDRYLAEISGRIDTKRVHLLGNVSYETFLSILQISACHVYLTYPFVLSWSMLEAMSAGCLVIGSKTPPVEEVITDGINGILTDFFSHSELTYKVVSALSEKDKIRSLRTAARKTVQERYDLKRICIPAQLSLLNAVATGAIGKH